MKEKTDKPKISNEARTLRKKVKRIEESRSSIKAKSHEKGQIIKAHQDREVELKKNRDDWKAKCKDREKECAEMDEKYKHIAALFEMKEEQLKEILKEFEELKKKAPRMRLR